MIVSTLVRNSSKNRDCPDQRRCLKESRIWNWATEMFGYHSNSSNDYYQSDSMQKYETTTTTTTWEYDKQILSRKRKTQVWKKLALI